VATPFGLFEFLRLPFGLRNTGSTFQRLLDRVLCGLPWCFWYLDDIIAASASREEHLVHLQQLFERLHQHNLVINAEKCVFGVAKVEFLGHEVTAQGARPLKSHVTALQNHPPPTNIQQLQAFLGLVNFYRRFVKGAARLLKPLTDCLLGGKSSKDPVDQSAEFLVAVEAAKQAVAEAALLAHPINGAEICLMVDASDVHVGASLQQRTSSAAPWQPLGFFSKKLEAAQQRYSAFDRELWACFAGIRHFRFMLEGRRFITLLTISRLLLP
jgi:cleavage and polyadenylation specificity factor subunit 1